MSDALCVVVETNNLTLIVDAECLSEGRTWKLQSYWSGCPALDQEAIRCRGCRQIEADDIAGIVDPGRLTVDVGRQVRRVGGVVEVGERAGRLLIDVGELQRRPGNIERRVTHILTNIVIAEQLVKRCARRNNKAEHAA